MKGLTLWEFGCALMCSQLCCVLQLHAHTDLVVHHIPDHTLCIHFITFAGLVYTVYSHIICLTLYQHFDTHRHSLHLVQSPRALRRQCCCDTGGPRRDVMVEVAWLDVVWTQGLKELHALDKQKRSWD